MKKLFKRSRQLLLMLAALLMGANSTWADELTVADGTNTNSYVPFYGNWGDAAQKCEFIIPAADLSDMIGKEITALKFYSNTASQNWTGTFLVFLKEVDEETTTLSNFTGTTDATTVFSGTGLAVDANKEMAVTFSTSYTYNGGNLLVGFYQTEKGNYKGMSFYGVGQAAYTAWQGYSSSGIDAVTGSGKQFIPKTTFTYEDKVEGPGLLLFDVNSKLATTSTYDFGLAVAGTPKTFTMKNPGTESVTVNIEGSNGFGVSPANATIAAKGEETLTITMAATTASGAVTITPTASSVDTYTINVSGTIKDPNKLFEDFSGNAKPEDWTATGKTTYSWSFTNGYASYGGYNASYAGNLTTPKLSFSAGEKFFFDAKMSSTYNATAAGMTIQTSTDGNSFSDLRTISSEDIDFSIWNSFSIEIPSDDVKYIRFANCIYMAIDNVYGGTLPQEPKMVVTQPASLDFGAISETTTKTFTIANTGLATLSGITVTSSNSEVFAITGAPTSLEAGTSQEVTIAMSADQTGALSSEITVSATDMEDVKFTVTGAVVPAGLFVVDFNDNALPEGWGNNASNKWSFGDGKAYCTNSAELTTPKLQFAEGDLLVIKATSYDDYDNNYLEITGSADGTNWNAFETKKYVTRSQIPYGSYATLVVTDIPATTKYLKFKGFYVRIDEIAGLTYAPELAVTMNGEAVTSPATYDFGEKLTKDETVTYNFANKGAGTIYITGVSITGEGAAAYSTKWTESVAVPYDLEITRSYDGTRTGVQEATVNVTTSEGDFVINVSGSDQGLNAPELSIDATPIDFGKLAANDTKTITVTNAGTGLLTVNIESDNALFTVSPAQLTDIAAGESETFNVTFNYDNVAGNYGEKTANITVTPTYDESANVIISAMAKAKNPSVWSEEFTDDPTVDRGWTADAGWNFTDGKAVGGGSGYLTSPWLTVTGESDELVFDYEGTTSTSSWGIYVYYAVRKYGEEWPSSNSYSYLSELVKPDTKGTYTITGLEAGTYQIRFKYGSYALDNFEGFTRFIPAHDAEITSVNIPTNGYVGREYKATVTVTEKLGKDENATAKLYIDGAEMVTATQALTPNDATEIELTFTPDAAVSYKAAYIEVTYDGGTLTGETKYVTIKPVYEYAENQTNEITTGNMLAVVLKRSFIQGWNTICLPFGISSPKSYFGDDVKVYEFNSYSTESGLSFKAINLSNGMDAGVPYLAYIPSAVGSELFFENVSVSTTMPNVTKGNVTFHGTYSPIAAGDLTGNYILTTEAKIAKAGASASLKAFRAYFTAPAEARMTISFDDNTTGIGAITTDGELEVGTLYNLKGQKVQGTQKGLYILNGKKVVIK